MTAKKSEWKRLFEHRSGVVGLVLVTFLVLVACVGPMLLLTNPYEQNFQNKFIPPQWQQGGLTPYLLGTDILGRDLLARLVVGARLSLLIGMSAVLIGALFGIPVGMVSGFAGGKIDLIIMRLIDVMLAFPTLLLAICIVAILGPSLSNATIAIGIVSLPTFARMTRTKVMSEREKDYVLADVAIGKRKIFILFSSILKNIWGPILVIATLAFGGAILDAAGLSFLGLGAQPPTPEWGALIAEGRQSVFQAPWLVLYPGAVIFVTVLSFNLLGDALRDVFDPKN